MVVTKKMLGAQRKNSGDTRATYLRSSSSMFLPHHKQGPYLMISKQFRPQEETENQKHVLASAVRSRNAILMESITTKTLSSGTPRQITDDLRNEPVCQPHCMCTLPYVIGEENVLLVQSR